MLNRIISWLLIGTTLLGSSFCCCTMRVVNAESISTRTCCHKNHAQHTCPPDSDKDHDSDGDNKHPCPCHKHEIVGTKLTGSLMLPSSSGKFLSSFSELCAPAMGLMADGTLSQRIKLSAIGFDAKPTGTDVLIAHCVRRC